jgi:hypothetical protein
LGDVFFRDLDVEILPESAETATRLLCSVLLLQKVHEIQYLLLFFSRQIAEFLEDLLFYRHRGSAWGQPETLYPYGSDSGNVIIYEREEMNAVWGEVGGRGMAVDVVGSEGVTEAGGEEGR